MLKDAPNTTSFSARSRDSPCQLVTKRLAAALMSDMVAVRGVIGADMGLSWQTKTPLQPSHNAHHRLERRAANPGPRGPVMCSVDGGLSALRRLPGKQVGLDGLGQVAARLVQAPVGAVSTHNLFELLLGVAPICGD